MYLHFHNNYSGIKISFTAIIKQALLHCFILTDCFILINFIHMVENDKITVIYKILTTVYNFSLNSSLLI